MAHLRTFPLPGGEAAIRAPRLAALGLLYELYGARARHLSNLWLGMRGAALDMRLHLLGRGVNCPRTSSAGRLFDAVAALTGLCADATFEAQAAMQLEYAAERARDAARPYPFRVVECSDAPWVIDWADSIEALLADRDAGLDAASIAARFHATLAAIVAAVAQRSGEQGVALSGGCFQNRVLTELSVERLQALGLQPLWHRMVPPNDAGLAFGQLEAAARTLRREAT
jgi:hydrogenase maturation protein HypF